MEAFVPPGPITLRLGEVTYDLSERALVMGILNRTSDSFFVEAATPDLDQLLFRAEDLVVAGADILDVGGVKAGPGDEVSIDEELDRVVPAIAALRSRFNVALSVDTWRSSVAEAAFREGAVLGNDISGFSDPQYLSVAHKANASVVATHIRLRPREPDPTPHYDNVTATVEAYLRERCEWISRAGIGSGRIILDAGLDLGKNSAQSLQLLRDSATLAAIGPPLLLSASNKGFLGELFELSVTERREATLAAISLGVSAGARVLRVHDVVGATRVRDALAAVMGARS